MPDLTRRGNLWRAPQQMGLKWSAKPKVDADGIEVEPETVVPSRRMLRAKKIGVVRKVTTNPYGRLTRFRMSEPSIDTLVAVHQKMADGRTRKIVIPRDRIDGIDQKKIFGGTNAVN